MKFETKLSKEQFLEAIKAGVRAHLHPTENFEYQYRLTAAVHLADYAREQWGNDEYLSIFMGGGVQTFTTEADADSYFGDQYQMLVEAFEEFEEVEEDELDEDTIYTPEQFIEKLEVA